MTNINVKEYASVICAVADTLKGDYKQAKILKELLEDEIIGYKVDKKYLLIKRIPKYL